MLHLENWFAIQWELLPTNPHLTRLKVVRARRSSRGDTRVVNDNLGGFVGQRDSQATHFSQDKDNASQQN